MTSLFSKLLIGLIKKFRYNCPFLLPAWDKDAEKQWTGGGTVVGPEAPCLFVSAGNVVNIQTGHWVGKQSGLGAGLDSFYEYLLKSYILFGEKEDLEMFNAAYQSIQSHLRRGYVSLMALLSPNSVFDSCPALFYLFVLFLLCILLFLERGVCAVAHTWSPEGRLAGVGFLPW